MKYVFLIYLLSHKEEYLRETLHVIGTIDSDVQILVYFLASSQSCVTNTSRDESWE